MGPREPARRDHGQRRQRAQQQLRHQFLPPPVTDGGDAIRRAEPLHQPSHRQQGCERSQQRAQRHPVPHGTQRAPGDQGRHHESGIQNPHQLLPRRQPQRPRQQQQRQRQRVGQHRKPHAPPGGHHPQHHPQHRLPPLHPQPPRQQQQRQRQRVGQHRKPHAPPGGQHRQRHGQQRLRQQPPGTGTAP